MVRFENSRAATTPQVSAAKPCAEDNRTRVSANEECLVIETYGESAEQTTLIIFIHGDDYRRDPSDYRPSDYMFRIARTFGTKGVVAVGLIRPGYFDSTRNYSTGTSHRDKDNYQPDVIETVAAAVKVLKNHHKAENVILAGHSGGSAISGVIIGKFPGLVNAAVLGACPCNVPVWRTMRRGHNNWPLSLSPHDFIGGVDKNARVVAITGANDGNTEPVLARDYVASLKANGIDAINIEVPGVGHKGLFRTADFTTAISQLLAGRP